MRIVLMSDSHGNYIALNNIVKRNLTADLFVHLGDGEKELDRIALEYPHLQFYHVKGNCDFASFSQSVLILPLENSHKLIATHGHEFDVRYSLDRLKKLAIENNADIIAFGHTHVRYTNYDDGLYVINPGSASSPRDGKSPSYAFIDITTAGVVTNIVSLI